MAWYRCGANASSGGVTMHCPKGKMVGSYTNYQDGYGDFVTSGTASKNGRSLLVFNGADVAGKTITITGNSSYSTYPTLYICTGTDDAPKFNIQNLGIDRFTSSMSYTFSASKGEDYTYIFMFVNYNNNVDYNLNWRIT